MKKKVLFICFFCLISGLVIFTITRQLFWTEEKGEVTLTPVVISYPKMSDISHTLYYSGTLIPKNTVTIISKVPGKIENIFVKKGDFVTKNQRLVKIEDNTVNLQKQQAFSFLKVAEAQYEKAKKGPRQEKIENVRALVFQAEEDFLVAEENFNRTKKLYENGTISKASYDEAERILRSAKTSLENSKRTLKLMEEGASEEEIKIAKANAEAAKAQFEIAKLQEDFTKLETPVFGMVAEIFAQKGNMVSTSTPILAIVQINPILAKITIPEKYYGEFLKNYKNMDIIIYPNAYPDSAGFKGKITAISPVIDPMSRTFYLEIEVTNPLKKLRPGMYINVEIILEIHKNALVLPLTALVSREGKNVVFILEKKIETIAINKEVAIGLIDSDIFEITDGLSEESIVIVEGNLFLEHGQKVRIISER